MDTCIIQDELNDRMVETVRRIATELGISAYDEDTHRGTLRHIMVRTGQTTKDIMIVLVMKTKNLPEKDKLIDEIRDAFPSVKSIVHNVNNQKTNVILGKETKVIWGDEYIYDMIGDIKFMISPKSFYQVNPTQTKNLYDKALEYADLRGGETVIDAYCGIGTISLSSHKKRRKCTASKSFPKPSPTRRKMPA